MLKVLETAAKNFERQFLTREPKGRVIVIGIADNHYSSDSVSNWPNRPYSNQNSAKCTVAVANLT